MFAQIALPIPHHSTFTYRIPSELRELCQPGCLALVPVAASLRQGVVWSLAEQPEWTEGEAKPIVDILTWEPLFNQQTRRFLEWIANYYLRPLGEVVATALPSHLEFTRQQRAVWSFSAPLPPADLPGSLRELATALAQRKRLAVSTLTAKFGRGGLHARLHRLSRLGLITIEEEWRPRHRLKEEPEPPPPEPAPAPLTPTPEQAECNAALLQALEENTGARFLLEGVTGSGKTEVYFQAVAECLRRGRQVLILVPEIALTPQLEERFRERFATAVAIFHSGQSERSRFDHWQQLRRGAARVVIGARSALFAPFDDLGLVIVDEEHEPAYKQDTGVPYHGRDMAVVRAGLANAVVVLGSATPSLESRHNVALGKYRHLKLLRRATGALLPTVRIVDLKAAPPADHASSGLLSPELRTAMTRHLEAGGQVLLFLNRRGYSPVLLCWRCGTSVGCPHCSVALTMHRPGPRLICHYCGERQAVPELCPTCRQLSLTQFGVGTQRLQEEVAAAYPEYPVARMDRDTVSASGGELEALLAAMHSGQTRILIGTQMVAKGHHFPGLSLVGVILAETGMFQPDFRAAERTFQLVAQVAGRAGREERPGEVIVQTFDPAHYAITTALEQNGAALARIELPFRQEAGYPPYRRLALLRFSTPKLEEGEGFAIALRQLLPPSGVVEYLGPAPAPVFKVRNRFRWQLMIKELTPGRLHAALRELLARVRAATPGTVRLEWDVDPHFFG